MNYKRIDNYLEIEINKDVSIIDIFKKYRLSKKNIHNLRMSKNVYVNNKAINQNLNTLLKSGDKLKLPIFTPMEIDFISQDIPIDIVYEDDFILVINKSANIEVHPDNKKGINTLVNGVANYYKKTNQKCLVRYIHRLDKDTTGGIIFTKNYFVQNLLDDMLANKEIKRLYLALVINKPNKKSGNINTFISRDRHHNQRRIVSKTGQLAKTYYNTLKIDKNYSLVELELFSGRTHQIRVHMKHINCPLLGDKLYGEASNLINRQALHAFKIKMVHPITFEPLVIEIPLPDDFKKLIKS